MGESPELPSGPFRIVLVTDSDRGVGSDAVSQITVTDSDSGMETESHMFWVPFRRFYEIHPRRLAAALALLIFTVGAVAATGLVLVGVVGVIVGVIIGLVLGLLGIFGLDGWREQIREHRSAP